MIAYEKFQPKRTFGVELEFTESVSRSQLAAAVRAKGENAEQASYGHNHDNPQWFCKTDSSCGVELASRKLGSYESINTCVNDLKLLTEIADEVVARGGTTDGRCGLHVHLGIQDLNRDGINKFLYYWMKYEKMILDMMPARRVGNRYCPTHTRELRANLTPRNLPNDQLRRYFSQRGAVNLGHLDKHKIEIRCAEGTTDSRNVKNWVRFLLHFMEKSKIWDLPTDLNWYDPISGLKQLGLLDKDTILSPALSEMREWVLARTIAYAKFQDKNVVRAILTKLHDKLYPTPYGTEEDLS